MTAEHVPLSNDAPRRGRVVYLAALVVVAAIVLAVAIVVRARQAPPVQAPAAEDCEKAKPKVEFAVAECEGGAAPAKGGQGGAQAPAKH